MTDDRSVPARTIRLMRELNGGPDRQKTPEGSRPAHPGPTGYARVAWLAIIPSVFVLTFAGLLYMTLSTQAGNGVMAGLEAAATAEGFLRAPAEDPSVPRASDVLSPSGSETQAEPVPTF